ncbi:hypothetical protein AFE_1867 [Acidithiobacillus ferrooxidans ATCC 23270]|uniref:DUF2147 domain-containing protein n=2 Tax=Acidithiobacillus ferrooxidans TaxID=920 RepID=B7JBW9_ACIF2|nr:hypothetical protein AFE_1867 [Acidithiobacillus ferrooxidans ATCC 23270]
MQVGIQGWEGQGMKRLLARCFILTGLLLGSIGIAFAGTERGSITGLWQTAGGNGYIRIYAKNGVLFGQSVRHMQETVQQARAEGQPQILADFVPRRPGEWAKGRIYDPNSKTYYHGTLTTLDSRKLKVYGYVGFSWLGGNTIWTKVPSKSR